MSKATRRLNSDLIGAACAILAVAITAVGCGTSTPLAPSIGTATLMVPSDGAQVANTSQPVTLVVQNEPLSGSSVTTYTFEVATDAAFTTKVQTKSGVAQGSGQTSVTLDALTPGTDYYWRVRAQTAQTTGGFTAAFKFTIGSAVTISAPAPVAPLNATETAVRPTLTVTNAGRQGPSGTIVYVFELASNPGFTSVVVTGTVNEGQGRTSFTLPGDLAPSQIYYWRATAVDQTNNASSSPSAVQNFTTGAKTRQGDLAAQLGVALWPTAHPTGTNGRAILGDNWNVQTLYHAPSNTTFRSPPIEGLRLFDLMDRGMTPQGAIDWLASNGYPTTAQYYASIDVIGVPLVYIARINGRWDLVLRGE